MYTQKMTTLTLGGTRENTRRFLETLKRNIAADGKTPEQAALLAAINNVATTDSNATLIITHPQSAILANRLAALAGKQGLTAAVTGPMEFYQLQVQEAGARATPFLCLAENEEHARKQAEDMYPGCTVLSNNTMSAAMENKAKNARLWLATVGHTETVAAPDAHLFWQVTEPTEDEVLARYEGLFDDQIAGLEVEAVLDISRALEFAPENAEALVACQTNLPQTQEGSRLFILTGRLPADDVDTTHAIQAKTEEIARLAFEVEIYKDRGDSVSRTETIAEWGTSIVFNQVLELTPDRVLRATHEAQLRAALDSPENASTPITPPPTP